MATVQFTYALRRFFPEIKPIKVDGDTVRMVIEQLEQQFPGMRSYILDDQGRLREHVNIFLNNELIKDRVMQSDVVQDLDEVFVMQALSGGL
jgi:molybdopterin converting factor small subunit